MTTKGDSELDLPLPLDDSPGPATRISSARAQAMVERALDAAGPVPVPIRPKRAPWRLLLVAALVLGLAGVAVAATLHYLRRTQKPTPPAQVAATATPHRAVAPAPPSASASAEPAPVQSSEAEPVAPTVHRKPAASVTSAPKRPKDLLALANHKRAAHKWREADALYHRVMAGSPGTAGAYVAEVASASLHAGPLHDPRGALRMYQHALAARPNGSLGEEIRYGIAVAYRELGNHQAEQSALSAFLARYPHSAMKSQVEARLHKLEGATP